MILWLEYISLTVYRNTDILKIRGEPIMTVMELLKEKGLSRYSLSKKSGVPWATLSDICYGKTSLNRCNARTISKLSHALELSVEEILKLEAEPREAAGSGKPADKSYLEANLSFQLTKAIEDYKQGEKAQAAYLDCLWDELYGSINADLWAGGITQEQAVYLRTKYLQGGEQEEEDD